MVRVNRPEHRYSYYFVLLLQIYSPGCACDLTSPSGGSCRSLISSRK